LEVEILKFVTLRCEVQHIISGLSAVRVGCNAGVLLLKKI